MFTSLILSIIFLAAFFGFVKASKRTINDYASGVGIGLAFICFLLFIGSVGSLFAKEVDSTATEFEKSFNSCKGIVEGVVFKDGKEEALKQEINDIEICLDVIRIQLVTLRTLLIFDHSKNSAINLREVILENDSIAFHSVKEMESKLIQLKKPLDYSATYKTLNECLNRLDKCVNDLNNTMKRHLQLNKEKTNLKEV